MHFTSKFLSSIALAIACATSGVFAAPFAPSSKFGTHSVRTIGRRGLVLETFHPESSYETFGVDGVEHPLEKRSDATIEEITKSFVSSRLGVSEDAVQYRAGYKAQTAEHAYIKQVHNGIPFANSVGNIAYNKDGKVVAFGSSFSKPKKIASSTPKISIEDAIKVAEDALDGKYNDWPATLEYVVKSDNTAALAHVVQIQNDETGAWYEAFVDAHEGELFSVVDFISHATYRVLPITKETVPEGFETLEDPEDTTASPFGWLSTDGTTIGTTTAGNNVIAYQGSQSSPAAQSGAGEFIYTADASLAPAAGQNKPAAITNAFYIVNSIHDLSYKYGFTEAAFNFQAVNAAGTGGKANDRVLVSVQDSSGTNNANFATPADGQQPQMRMFLWTLTSVRRDGALENDIVVHENTHGISNRLTGGGTGRCLQTTEAGGMGEGWSDALADWTEKTTADVPDYVMGQYVINDPAGIRSAPYSTSATTNPLRYSTIQSRNEVHDIGEIWANLLHNVYAALVGEHGFDIDARTNPDSTAGNAVWLHLFIDGLALQPCQPTFVTARNAWIQADANRYGGANACTLWKAFASRGLGVNAANHVDDSTVPAECT